MPFKASDLLADLNDQNRLPANSDPDIAGFIANRCKRSFHPELQQGLASLSGLAAGTRILTDLGPSPIENIRPGDRVRTKAGGYAQVKAVGKYDIQPKDIACCPTLRPIVVPAGTFGNVAPLKVMPSVEFLIQSERACILFETGKVLVNAHSCLDYHGVDFYSAQRTSVFHVLSFDNEEVINADGAWVSSGPRLARSSTPHRRVHWIGEPTQGSAFSEYRRLSRYETRLLLGRAARGMRNVSLKAA
ncbi:MULTISPECIES: Hint domain-containing protein [Halocynthiibacter]|uniref:Hint domain-containing protein n=1 Tax=Halocynthiibacter halioticoli TaxID=2986804 RepID=A0AAE3J1U9_9RHOB|nr:MULTISPECIES: Hint domain-containing protein [Halocynthiibacter]MCV6825081.1 Hint domain-containing protein [Halocynthiibacter halioticoli]MCW4058082.1 Hint domain-containing protein [Halocynthiibacter sp. SDUM655004]